MTAWLERKLSHVHFEMPGPAMEYTLQIPKKDGSSDAERIMPDNRISSVVMSVSFCSK